MGMNEPLPSAFEAKRQGQPNLARAVREMLGWDLKQAATHAGIDSSIIECFEKNYILWAHRHAPAITAAYTNAGAAWGSTFVSLTQGVASDRSAIRAAMVLVHASRPALASDIEQKHGIPRGDILHYLSHFGPRPHREVVQACIDYLAMRSGRLCHFDTAPIGGWKEIRLVAGAAR